MITKHKSFFVKSKGRLVKVKLEDLYYVKGCRNYVKVVTETKTYIILCSMKSIENFLPSAQFIRIQKSYIIAPERITSFDATHAYIQEKQLPIGLQYKGELQKKVLIINEVNSPVEAA